MSSGCRFPNSPDVIRVHTDDWLVNVLLTDGRVYTFMTEMWPEHLEKEMGPAVIARAKEDALWLANRNSETWAIEEPPGDEKQFVDALNQLCHFTSDAEFARFVRH